MTNLHMKLYLNSPEDLICIPSEILTSTQERLYNVVLSLYPVYISPHQLHPSQADDASQQQVPTPIRTTVRKRDLYLALFTSILLFLPPVFKIFSLKPF